MAEKIYGLYSSRGHNEWLRGADTDPEALRLRHNVYQKDKRYAEPEIPKGDNIVRFRGSTGGGLDFPPHCYVEIRLLEQFDEKE